MIRVMGMDVETSSAAPLTSVGAAVYLHHPTTIVLMMAYKPIGDTNPTRLWRKGDQVPQEIIDHVLSGGYFSGWNVMYFDRIAYGLHLVPLGFPPIDDDHWKDSMQLAAAANLPRSLDGAAAAVGAPFQSDLKDKGRIQRITNQAKTSITIDANDRVFFGDRTKPQKPDDILKWDMDMSWLCQRCVQDVDLEEGVLIRLPPWPEVQPWISMPYIDRKINDRGVLIDIPLIQGMARAAADETNRLDGEMNRLTNGQVAKTSTIEQLKKWLLWRGVDVPLKNAKLEAVQDGTADPEDHDVYVADQALLDEMGIGVDTEQAEEKTSAYRLRKNDIANILATDGVPDDCRQALFWRQEAAKASVRKLRAMERMATSDNCLHGFLALMGAQATGRFASGGPQLHNMVRDAFGKDYENIAEANGLNYKTHKAEVKRLATQALATAIEAGRRGDADELRMMYHTTRKDLQGRSRVEGALPWISRMMRRTIAANVGHLLLNGDFANIQARIPVWLAGQQDTVDQFARGEDLYRIQAAPVYNKAPETLTSEERQIGKVMRLFLSFGAGVNAFIPAAMIYGIVIPRSQGAQYVQLFRDTNQPLVNFWNNNLACARAALEYPGREFHVPPMHYVSWFKDPKLDCLCMRLPSGRLMRYWSPRLEYGQWPDGQPKRIADLTALTVKGRFVFRRTLWRGLAMQNVTCAIEADLLCCALVNMERNGLPVRLHVHDNAAAEVREEDAERLLPIFKHCMLDMPVWTKGLPIAADCDASARFG